MVYALSTLFVLSVYCERLRLATQRHSVRRLKTARFSHFGVSQPPGRIIKAYAAGAPAACGGGASSRRGNLGRLIVAATIP